MDPSVYPVCTVSARVLRERFKDPYKPGGCSTVLHSCVQILRQCTIDVLLTDFHESLALLANFAFAPREFEHHEDLADTMGCACNAEDWEEPGLCRSLHGLAKNLGHGISHSDPQLALFMAMTACFNLINATLIQANLGGGFYKVVRRTTAAESRGDQSRWPTDLDDLFAYGTKHGLKAFLQWAEIDPRISIPVTRLLRTILQSCRGEVVPYIVSSPGYVTSLLQFVYELKGMKELRDNSPDAGSGDASHLNEIIGTVGDFLTIVTSTFEQHELLAFALNGPDGPALLRMCGDGLSLIEKLDKERHSSTPDVAGAAMKGALGLKDFGGAVYQAFKAVQHPALSNAGVHHAIIVDEASRIESRLQDPLFRGYHVLWALSARQRCTAPGCLATYARCGRQFKHCAGCERTPYCSPECQKQAWSDEIAPHKSVCRMIRRLGKWSDLPRKFSERDFHEFSRGKRTAKVESYAMAVWVYWERILEARTGLAEESDSELESD